MKDIKEDLHKYLWIWRHHIFKMPILPQDYSIDLMQF